MEQLSLLNENEINEGVVIPKNVLSPLESTKSIKSKEFREEQLLYSKYVSAIQSYHNCSFFKARDLFFKHRDDQKPIWIDFNCII